MRELDKIAEKLFDKIRTRFEHVNLGDEKSKRTTNPEKARFFNFDYISHPTTGESDNGAGSEGKNFGNVTISIIDGDGLKVFFSKNITDELGHDEQDEWFNFLRSMRKLAKKNFMSFDARDINKSNLDLRDIKQQSKADAKFSSSDVSGASAVVESNITRVAAQDRIPARKHHVKQMAREYAMSEEFEQWATSIAESTFEVDNDNAQLDDLRDIMSNELPVGIDAYNASNVLVSIPGFNDTDLQDRLFDLYKTEDDPTVDARMTVFNWMKDHSMEMAELADNLRDELSANDKEQSDTPSEEPPKPPAEPAQEPEKGQAPVPAETEQEPEEGAEEGQAPVPAETEQEPNQPPVQPNESVDPLIRLRQLVGYKR